MILPEDDEFKFFPAVKFARLESWFYYRWGAYHQTYADLADSYKERYPEVYSSGGMGLDEVNDLIEIYYPEMGSITGPFVNLTTDNETDVEFQYWLKSDPPPILENKRYAMAAVTGLLCYQMYSILLVLEGEKFVKGHFGRKPKH